jgi:hypothetical protein
MDSSVKPDSPPVCAVCSREMGQGDVGVFDHRRGAHLCWPCYDLECRRAALKRRRAVEHEHGRR